MSIKKKTFIILALMFVLSISFVVFSETIDELNDRFVTRQEWADYISSMEPILDGLEQNMQVSIQDECEYQMYRRDILSKEKLESMKEAASGGDANMSKKLASMDARKLEDSTKKWQY